MVRVLWNSGSFAGEGHRSTLRLEEDGSPKASSRRGIADCTCEAEELTPRGKVRRLDSFAKPFPSGRLPLFP
jgi:hypothetical protein